MNRFRHRWILPFLPLLTYSLLMWQTHGSTAGSESVSIEYAFPVGERLAYGLMRQHFLSSPCYVKGLPVSPVQRSG